MTPALIAAQYARTHAFIYRLAQDVSDEESVQVFPFGGNSFNWLLGHVTIARWNVLAMFGNPPPLWNLREALRYRPGSDPITSLADAVPVARLLSVFDDTQMYLSNALAGANPVDLLRPVEDETLGDKLMFYTTHEAFHAGQMELCRKLLGKPDVKSYE